MPASVCGEHKEEDHAFALLLTLLYRLQMKGSLCSGRSLSIRWIRAESPFATDGLAVKERSRHTLRARIASSLMIYARLPTAGDTRHRIVLLFFTHTSSVHSTARLRPRKRRV